MFEVGYQYSLRGKNKKSGIFWVDRQRDRLLGNTNIYHIRKGHEWMHCSDYPFRRIQIWIHWIEIIDIIFADEESRRLNSDAKQRLTMYWSYASCRVVSVQCRVGWWVNHQISFSKQIQNEVRKGSLRCGRKLPFITQWIWIVFYGINKGYGRWGLVRKRFGCMDVTLLTFIPFTHASGRLSCINWFKVQDNYYYWR